MNEAPAITGPGVVAGDNRELADADVLQGLWTEEQYLAVSGASKRLIEFTDGVGTPAPLGFVIHVQPVAVDLPMQMPAQVLA